MTTILEHAKKIRNMYNQYLYYSKEEAVLRKKLEKLESEMEKATYSYNGYEHFEVFGNVLTKEEAEHRQQILQDKYTRTCDCMDRCFRKLQVLLTNPPTKEP